MDNSTISSKSVLGDSTLQHDDKELSEEQWNSNIEIMVAKLNKQDRGIWATGKTEYGRRILSMTKGDTGIRIKVNAWGRHTVNKVDMYPAITIGTANPNSDMPIRRITSKNVNVMINNDTIKMILDDVFKQLNIELWKQIDCPVQSKKRHMLNFRNWQDALSKIAPVNPQERNSNMIIGDVLLTETIDPKHIELPIGVIKVSQVRKGEFANFEKFGFGYQIVTQISIDAVHGKVSANRKTESSDEMRRKLIAILESGMELESIHVDVEGSVDQMASITKKLADGKEIEVQ